MTGIEVPARPAPFELDPSTTAVVVVDMQNDFASPGGMFDRAGLPIAGIQAIVPKVRAVLDAARRTGIFVAYLKMAFQPDLADSGHPTSPTWLEHAPFHVGTEVTAPNGEVSRILIRDTWNTEIVEELAPKAGDAVIYKSRFSGFHRTGPHEVLQARGIQQPIIVGATTASVSTPPSATRCSSTITASSSATRWPAHCRGRAALEPRGLATHLRTASCTRHDN